MLPAHVRPWAASEPGRLRDVVGVMTDVDDTLTSGGRVPLGVVAALAALAASGLPTIAITGRPTGWSVPLARELPLAAIVAENGAVMLHRGRGADDVVIDYAQDEATRTRNAPRLAAAAARVLREVPGAALATDSAGRVTDIAVDHAEHAHLDAARIAQVVGTMRDEGLHATVSSIHVNGWFGEHDKLSGARWAVARRFGRELDAERERWVYVGDSTNDQLLFAHFPLSVGVANLMAFADRLETWPAFVTRRERGLGFVEVVERLLAVRPARGTP